MTLISQTRFSNSILEFLDDFHQNFMSLFNMRRECDRSIYFVTSYSDIYHSDIDLCIHQLEYEILRHESVDMSRRSDLSIASGKLKERG